MTALSYKSVIVNMEVNIVRKTNDDRKRKLFTKGDDKYGNERH